MVRDDVVCVREGRERLGGRRGVRRELEGARLAAQSAPGGGTTFYLDGQVTSS